MSFDEDARSDLRILDAKINCLLPPRYQHCYEAVRSTSMGSAALNYGADGRVAWGQIWTSFCDLAMAGGPPHRGRLLEPVRPSDVVAQPERYRAVLDELERGIRLTIDRGTVEGYEPGWVGVPCSTPEEACWLQAAVVAENISARRRSTVLQLPAGPDFRVEKEIKNIVVALAKVCHYWDGHLSDAQQSAFRGTTLCEPAEVAAAPDDYHIGPAALERRLREIANRPIDSTRYLGWLGLACCDEEMAAWLLRAVLVEGVLTRREGAVLYLPTGAGHAASEAERVASVCAGAWRLWHVVAGGAS